MFLFAFVLLGEDFFEPVSLALSDRFVHEYGIVKDQKFFTAAITAKAAHFHEACGRLLAQLTFLDCDCPHGDYGNSTHTPLTRLEIMISLMCGRYRLSRRKQLVEEYFDASGEEDWSPRYNLAPTQPIPVIRQHPKEPGRVLSLVRWGLIPSWAKDMSGSAGMINARSETAAMKPAFRDPMKFRRCLVPADGFYEWGRTGTTKRPFCFEVNERELFAFAGLWDRWRDPTGQWTKSCSILTTTPNAVTSLVHDRMPVIIEPDSYDLWLDRGMHNAAAISELLKPYDALMMRCYPVSTRVNHVANDDEECSRPVELAHIQNRLFAWQGFSSLE